MPIHNDVLATGFLRSRERGVIMRDKICCLHNEDDVRAPRKLIAAPSKGAPTAYPVCNEWPLGVGTAASDPVAPAAVYSATLTHNW